MAQERTLSIIKPGAVKKNSMGQIYSCFELARLKKALIIILPPPPLYQGCK